MRYLLIPVAALILTAGCRSPQAVHRARMPHASNNLLAVELASAASSAVQHQTVSIEDLVFWGLQNSPRLKETEYKIQSLRQRIPQELALPDPMLNSTSHLLPVETAAGRQVFGLGISQKVVSADRRQTRAAVAQDEVRAAEAELEKQRRELAEQIRVACLQLLEVRETIAVTQTDFEALGRIEKVILSRYEVDSDVSQQDVLNVQIEQSQVENQLSSLRQRERTYLARLTRLVHATPGSTFNLTDTIEDVTQFGSIDELIAQAFAARPELKAQLATIQRDRRKICLANLQSKPDFTLGLNWIGTSSNGISPVANGDDALMLGVGFNLPIYKNRIRAAVGEAASTSMASTIALQSIQDQIAEEVFDSIAQLESTKAMLSLLAQDIIPKSERALELSIEDYANGKSDYAQVIANWRSLLRYRIAQINLRSNRMQRMATLSRQVGQLEPVHTTVLPTDEDATIEGVSVPPPEDEPLSEDEALSVAPSLDLRNERGILAEDR